MNLHQARLRDICFHVCILFSLEMMLMATAEALDFVEAASRNENVIFRKKQEYEDSSVPFYLISPHGKFRLRWDILSVLLISCTLKRRLCLLYLIVSRADGACIDCR